MGKIVKIINYIFYHGLKKNTSWALVAHTSNLSYSGGRGQEDRGSKPAWANSWSDLISEKTKKGLVEWLKV
jgi:hypothetical protein